MWVHLFSFFFSCLIPTSLPTHMAAGDAPSGGSSRGTPSDPTADLLSHLRAVRNGLNDAMTAVDDGSSSMVGSALDSVDAGLAGLMGVPFEVPKGMDDRNDDIRNSAVALVRWLAWGARGESRCSSLFLCCGIDMKSLCQKVGVPESRCARKPPPKKKNSCQLPLTRTLVLTKKNKPNIHFR